MEGSDTWRAGGTPDEGEDALLPLAILLGSGGERLPPGRRGLFPSAYAGHQVVRRTLLHPALHHLLQLRRFPSGQNGDHLALERPDRYTPLAL